MFVCRACLRKGLGPLPYVRTTQVRLVTSLRTIPSHGLRRRTFATVNQPAATSLATNNLRDMAKSNPDEEEDSPAMKKLEWVVKKHLQYLKDPKLIADHVKATLQKDRYLEALLLTRKASRDTKVTVSWNHLIDYTMKAQRLHASIKLYNEMKKRGQTPDATTYTIIFRGCAASQHPKLAVAEALKIYNKMITIGQIKPNTIHFNAVLEVCARAGDIESLFTVVQTANEGLRNPNNLSYTIILNALRHQGGDTKDMSQEQIWNNKIVAINRARSVWEEVIGRWRDAQVSIDEELVCAMGRILATGDKLANDSIMELLEQTMQIPNFHKKEREAKAALAEPATETSSEETATVSAKDGDSAQTETTSEEPTLAPAKLRPRATSSSSSSSSSIIYPKPGNNTLSLILSSLHKTGKTTLGPKYWDYLTKEMGVVPDKDNYLRYLRVLTKGRASAKAAEIIPLVPTEALTPMLYRLAFTCCIYDKFNNNAFEHSKTIFRDMIKRVRIPDPLAMRLFLTSARANFASYEKDLASKDADLAEKTKLKLSLQLTTCLDMMWVPFRVLTRSFNFPQEGEPPSTSPQKMNAISKERKKEMLHAARKMISAYDNVLHGAVEPPKSMSQILKARKTVLVQMVERFTLKMEQAESSGGATSSRREKEAEDEEDDGWREISDEDDFETSFKRADSSSYSSSSRGGGKGRSHSKFERGSERRRDRDWSDADGDRGQGGRKRGPVSVYKHRKPRDRLRWELGERL
ncbi:hypothetical protein V8F20_005862 [Naviculisporaceae sp. PSN 640]